MWKFVTRRFKDTVERTYNVLDVRQTWTCGVDSKKDTNSSCHSTSVATKTDTSVEKPENLYSWRRDDSKQNKRKSWQEDEYFRNECHDRFGSHCSFLSSAVRTTATILTGIYLSQVISLLHRRRNLRHLDAKHSLHLFEHTHNQLHRKNRKNYCFLYWANSVYEKSFVPFDKRQKKTVYNDVSLEKFYRPVPVNNDHLAESTGKKNAKECDVADEDHVTEAIENLMSTLGNIEFQLGLQNIQAHEHKLAVSHFKLATTHRHAGATFNLGVCYEMGIGVDKNMKSAMECYRAASALGHKKAMYNLGVFYARGEGGLTKNRKAAAACLLAADKLGLQGARTVFDIPKDMRKPDDEINFKTTKMAIEDVHEVHQRSYLYG